MTLFEFFSISFAIGIGALFAVLVAAVLAYVLVVVFCPVFRGINCKLRKRFEMRVRLSEKPSKRLAVVQPEHGGRAFVVFLGDATLTKTAPDSDVFILSLPHKVAETMGLTELAGEASL